MLFAIAAGLALGGVHFYLYQKMLESLMGESETARFTLIAVKVGLLRHVFTFAAGFLMISEADLDPVAVCGGLFLATVLYRARLML